MYVWADGIHSDLRAEEQRVCLLVVIGVNERGEKHFLAIEDGVRESTESWRGALRMAESRAEAQLAFDRFLVAFRAKYAKATECLAKDRASLLAFYDFPAEHWIHIRTTNPIESTFATIRHRTERTKGCVSRATLLGLTFKLAMSAEQSWSRLRGFERLAEVVAGVKFIDGMRQEKQRQTKLQLQQAAA